MLFALCVAVLSQVEPAREPLPTPVVEKNEEVERFAAWAGRHLALLGEGEADFLIDDHAYRFSDPEALEVLKLVPSAFAMAEGLPGAIRLSTALSVSGAIATGLGVVLLAVTTLSVLAVAPALVFLQIAAGALSATGVGLSIAGLIVSSSANRQAIGALNEYNRELLRLRPP